jgi:hypothetical protein|tara:strand:+ start:979 stop:1296 length:318 start_codon:yes stop_codon:yes gene_type:complete
MKLLKFIFNFFLLIIILNSCTSFTEVGKVLRNEKSQSSDEFLIEKKGPLTQPPDFKSIPKPGQMSNQAEKKTSFENILNQKKKKPINSSDKKSSVEESILEKIKK